MSQRHFDFFHSKDEGLSMHQAWQGAQDLGRLNAVSNAFGYRLRTHRNCIFDSRTEVVRVVQVGVGATWPKCIQNASKMHPNAATLTLLTLRTRFNSTKEVCRFETYQNPLGVTLAMFHWTLSATRLDTRSLYLYVFLYLCCKSGTFNRNNSTT